MKLLGIFSVLFLIFALSYAEVKWGPDPYKTFSRLIAKRRSSIIYYFLTFLVFLTTFSMFIFGWFIPTFKLPPLFIAIYTLSVIAQFVCVTIPETNGIKAKVHLAAAGVMSASVLMQTILLVLLISVPLPVFIVSILSILLMALIWTAHLLKLTIMKKELATQALYFASYLLTVLLIGYTV